jgi:hypothetical protein
MAIYAEKIIMTPVSTYIVSAESQGHPKQSATLFVDNFFLCFNYIITYFSKRITS